MEMPWALSDLNTPTARVVPKVPTANIVLASKPFKSKKSRGIFTNPNVSNRGYKAWVEKKST